MRSPSRVRLALAGLASLLVVACGDDPATESPDAGTPDVELVADADSGDVDASDAGDDADADPLDALPERPWPLEERGHFRPGYSYTKISYLPRGDGEEEREIFISIWYPTLDSEGRPARYLNSINAPGVLREPAPAIDEEEPAPLMVFSHGNGSFSVQSYFFAEYLTSHGYVVIAPDHKGNTFGDTGGAVRLESTVYRPQDVSAILDWVEALPEDHALYGKISPSKIAISGHSLGGFTTLANTGATLDMEAVTTGCADDTISDRICEIFENDENAIFDEGFLDARFKASIPMTPAGAEVYVPGTSAIEIPTLMWTAGRDLTLPNEREGDPLWEAMEGVQHRRIDIANGGHFTFSNLCELLGGAVDDFQEDGCSATNMGYEEAYLVINAYSMAFLRLHLDGDTTYEAMLNGEDPLSDQLIFDRHE
ncbi:alpha/beta fold hydrolase [Lujinxingia vulgaris]|uniref:Alpha/beta fold hydrolase n=1 Tax=Lujinxingia vulgaris TaxID=2600176 RepID=A0A5C6X0H7_9DELT|nr:alpha/beta fold hydrolase [Lujinxingia vulgaris]TXD31633.1 alpha/beta fold hydrolase [Lujinxingia vulgaris]